MSCLNNCVIEFAKRKVILFIKLFSEYFTNLINRIFRSPFGSDESIDLVFEHVNRAWLSSFYNTTPICKTNANYAKVNKDFDNSNNNINSNNYTEITAELQCPLCPRKIKLISITGGTFVHSFILNCHLIVFYLFYITI